MSNTRTIRVTGKGQIKVKPDTTRITMTLEGTYPEYGKALRHSSLDTEHLKDVLSAFGFERSDLKTLNFNVETEYESYKDKGTYKQRFIGCVDSAFFQSQANAIQQQLDAQRTRLRQYQKQVDLTPILRETKRLMESLEQGDYQMWFSLQVVSVKLSATEIRFTMKNKLVFTEQRGDRT